jgi:uncharacterized protein (DUF433 family)
MGDRPSHKHEIDRVDNDDDYCPSNCQWATRTHNIRNSRHTKLDADRVLDVIDDYNNCLPIEEIEAKYGITQASISAITTRKTWTDVTAGVYIMPRHHRPHRGGMDILKAREIRARRAEGERNVDLAKAYGIGREAISRIVNGKTWKEAK